MDGETVRLVLTGGCLVVVGSVLLADAMEKAVAFLKQWSLTIGMLVFVAFLIVQASPRAWQMLMQRGGQLTRPVATAIHKPLHR